MPRILVAAGFKFAVDGLHVIEVEPGEQDVSERCAEVAVDHLKVASRLDGSTPVVAAKELLLIAPVVPVVTPKPPLLAVVALAAETPPVVPPAPVKPVNPPKPAAKPKAAPKAKPAAKAKANAGSAA